VKNPDKDDIARRVAQLDWERIGEDLDNVGAALIERLLEPAECESLAALYDGGGRFRSRVVMQAHGFGQGEYQYFDYPLPPLIAKLRPALYSHIVPIANRWAAALGTPQFPAEHERFLQRCRKAGQARATPLLLRYTAGDFNCLHQDLYGEQVFPLQATILLSRPERDFTGGEFVLVEQRPRMQSRAEVVPLEQGDAVVFAVRHRPAQGKRGRYRVAMRHGVSRLRSGERYTAGLIFHDAA